MKRRHCLGVCKLVAGSFVVFCTGFVPSRERLLRLETFVDACIMGTFKEGRVCGPGGLGRVESHLAPLVTCLHVTYIDHTW